MVRELARLIAYAGPLSGRIGVMIRGIVLQRPKGPWMMEKPEPQRCTNRAHSQIISDKPMIILQ